MSMCQSDTRGRVSVSSTSVLRPVVSGARWWVICTTGFPKACYLILHCKTLPHLSPQETLHMNLLRKPCLKLVAHHSRSCCVKGLHGLSMSALEQPCGDDFLTSVGSASVNPSELQTWTAQMAANQGCIVSASVWDKFFLSENLDLSCHLTI